MSSTRRPLLLRWLPMLVMLLLREDLRGENVLEARDDRRFFAEPTPLRLPGARCVGVVTECRAISSLIASERMWCTSLLLFGSIKLLELPPKLRRLVRTLLRLWLPMDITSISGSTTSTATHFGTGFSLPERRCCE